MSKNQKIFSSIVGILALAIITLSILNFERRPPALTSVIDRWRKENRPAIDKERSLIDDSLIVSTTVKYENSDQIPPQDPREKKRGSSYLL